MTGSATLSRALAQDFRSAALAPADRTMLEYSVALTVRPHGSDAQIDGLREAGFDDRAILDICQVTAYYNYVNRLADGLGVDLESHWEEDELTITREEFDRRVTDRKRSP